MNKKQKGPESIGIRPLSKKDICVFFSTLQIAGGALKRTCSRHTS